MTIEILSVELLDSERTVVDEFLQLSKTLEIGLGWHYLLDLSWAVKQLNPNRGLRVVDAGAGLGLMQWWLIGQGVDVVSIDRNNRRNLPDHFRKKYRVRGFKKNDLAPAIRLGDFLSLRLLSDWRKTFQKFFVAGQRLWWVANIRKPPGTLHIYNIELASISDIPDNSIDAVVSISALEHNSPETLRIIVTELLRVLKPGGKLIATLGAAKENDWFHEPSGGWCFTEHTLRDIFDLNATSNSNYDQYDELMIRLQNSDALKHNLSDFYFESGNNGMPWGIWNPQYQPVGVIKVKQ